MRQFIIKSFLMFMLLVSSLRASAWNFKVNGICYNIISNESPYKVEVTYTDSVLNNTTYIPLSNYEGYIDIPSTVSYNDRTYTVTRIGKYAFGTDFWHSDKVVTTVHLPSTIESIENGAFSGCKLQSINLPNSIKVIKKNAFSGCRNLSGITLPTSLETIEYEAFKMTAIRSIKIPDNVINIESCAFSDCDSLKTIEWPTVELTWGSEATKSYGYFEDCDGLEEVSIPANIPLEFALFRNCKGLKKVTLDASRQWIGSYCFYGCEALETINIGESMVYIHEKAFYDCRKLKSIVIPNTCLYIDQNAFEGCESLTNVQLSENLQTLGARSFADCTSLQDIRVTAKSMMDDDYYSAYDGVFNNCTQLRNIIISNNVEKVRTDIFADCPNLQTLVVEEGNPVFDSRNNCNALIETATNTLWVGTANTIIPEDIKIINYRSFSNRNISGNISFPYGLEKIESGAFLRCRGITKVVLPETCTTLGGSVFSEMPDLKEVIIKSNIDNNVGSNFAGTLFSNCPKLESVEIDAYKLYSLFSNCSNLEHVKIGNNTKILSSSDYTNRLFLNCTKLKELTLPASLERIDDNYIFTGCDNLNDLYVSRKTPPVIYNADLGNFDTSLCTLHVPVGYKSVYQNTYSWMHFKEIKDDITFSPFVISGISYKELNDTVLSVTAPNNTVYYLHDLVLPGTFEFGGTNYTVTTIENAAFANYTELTSITLPSTLTSVGANILSNCTNLKTIYCQVSDPNVFDNSAFTVTNTTNEIYVYVPKGTRFAYEQKFAGHFNGKFICLEDDHVTQTGQNSLSAQEIKNKADNDLLLVSLQSHTTSSHLYINRDAKASSSFSSTGATTWIVQKYGDGYVLKDIYGRFLSGTTRPAQFTWNIKEATLYMPEDAEANITDIAAGYNSSKAVRWKVLPAKDIWINTSGANESTTIQWNNGAGCWSCIFTYEVKTELPVNVTYILLEDGHEIDRQVLSQLSNSQVEYPTSWDKTCYDYSTTDVIGSTDCTIQVTRTIKSKVYEQKYARASTIAAGHTYAIFNTAMNGTENRYGFYYAHNSFNLACNPIKPSELPDNDAYLWETESAGSGLLAFKNKSTETYINATQRVLGEATGWRVEPWTTTTAEKSGVNSLNENEIVTANAAISASDNVFTISNPSASGKSVCWNGNDTSLGNTSMPALWSSAHPFAFYEIQDVAYVFNTYILQEEDGTFVDKTVVKQRENATVIIPDAWLSNTAYSYFVSGQTGSESSTLIVTRIEITEGVPENGNAFRIKSAHGTYLTGKIYGTGSNARYMYQTDTDVSTIWFMTDNMLYNYATGKAFQGRGDASTITDFKIEEATGETGKYVVRFLPGSGSLRYLWAWSPSDTKANQADQNSSEAANTRFTLEAVSFIPFEVSNALYASLYLPVGVQSIEGITLNKVNANNNDHLNLEEVSSIAPNTPVIVKADVAGTYNLPVVKNGTQVDDNLLTGVAAGGETIDTEVNAYILGMDELGVGFFPLSATDRALKSFKAYYVPTGETSARAFYFGEGGVTGINGLLNTIEGAMFDLSGRRVEKARKGIYIVNGKKVLVK